MKNLLVLTLLIVTASVGWAQGFSSNNYYNYAEDMDDEGLINDGALTNSNEEYNYSDGSNENSEEDAEDAIDNLEYLEADESVIPYEENDNDTIGLADEDDPLARAYYLVGEQYERVGKPNKGQTFIKRAYLLDPDLEVQDDSNSSSKINLSSKEEAARSFNFPLANRSIINNYPQDEQAQVSLILFQFDRFTRGILSENINVIDSLLDDSIQINDQYLDKSDMLEAFTYIFDKGDLSQLTLSDLYQKEPVVILFDNGGIVKIDAKEQSTLKTLPFWREHQEIYFTQKEDGNWYISKILTDTNS